MSTAVGFSPVTPGNSIITGVTAAAGASGEAASPLGFIDALLGMLTQGVTLGTQTPADGETETQTGAEAELGNMATLGLAVDAAIKGDLPTAPVQAPKDSEQLLADLVAALTAIDDAAQSGEPIDPALHDKLSETLDELAGMLGITLPAPPAIDPVITAAAAGGVAAPAAAAVPDIELSSGLTIENKPLPPGFSLPAPAPADTEASADLAAKFIAAVDDAIDLPSKDVAPVVTSPTPAAPTEDAAIDPDSQLGQLLAKLGDIAEKLRDRAPNASAKLEAIVTKLTSRALDSETIAKLETELDAAGLDALLAPKPAGKPKSAAPSPSLFAAPNLAMPEVVAQPPKQTGAAPKAAEPAAPAEPDLAEPGEVKLAKDTQPADKPPAEPTARDRGSFAAHLSEARGEKLADQASQAQQTPTTQVKTELGVVAPKTVHAAYQAPVQQINVPQVAFEVVRQFNQGSSRFQIRLDPPELGRIDVRMQVDGDGNVHARMTVERAETLDLMQRDQRSLEKALAQAGLDSSKTSLEFSLRQNPFGRDGQGQQHGRDGSPFAGRGDFGASDEVPELSTTTPYRGMASASGVNLFV